MNIGDKVKLSNTKETGIIINFLRGDQVEVELDGWNSKQIFSKNELRLLEQPTENKEVAKPKPKNNFEKGVFLALKACFSSEITQNSSGYHDICYAGTLSERSP